MPAAGMAALTTLCPALNLAIKNSFAGKGTYTEAGNTKSGCSAFYMAGSRLIYSVSIVTNNAGLDVATQSLKAAQNGIVTFPKTAHLICLSSLRLTNTNTMILRAQLASFNCAFLVPGGGCFTL